MCGWEKLYLDGDVESGISTLVPSSYALLCASRHRTIGRMPKSSRSKVWRVHAKALVSEIALELTKLIEEAELELGIVD